MVKVRQDLTGMVFGRLTVLGQTEDYIKPNGKHEARWLCQCSCGNKELIAVLGYHLTRGTTKSCGCLQHEAQIQNGFKTKNLIPNTKKYNDYDLFGEYGIGLTNNTNKEFYFDLEDYNKIKLHTWLEDANGYIVDADTKELMHRLVMDCPNNFTVDHIRHKKYDNRKSNLRVTTQSQNNMNRIIQSNNTSGTTGVSFHKASGMWIGYIKFNGKQIRKYAKTKEDAIKLREQLEEQYFGEYSYKNSMEGNDDRQN